MVKEKRYTVAESMEAMRNDSFMCQIVRTVKMMVPNAKIYTDACYDACLYNVFLVGVSEEVCEDIGKMIRSDYTIDKASDNPDYPFYIDYVDDGDNLIDITNIV